MNSHARPQFAAVFFALLALVLFTGCATAPSPINSPIESPVATPKPPLLVATQDPKLGQVRGRLFVKRGNRSVPLKNIVVYLGQTVRSISTGEEGVVSLKEITAPQTQVEANGAFLIRNVPPGRYALVGEFNDEKLLLNHPRDGSAFIHEIKGSETIDLGDLTYTDLPYVEQPH